MTVPDSFPDKKTPKDPYEEVIDLMLIIKSKVKADAELMWTYYDSPQEIWDEIDNYLKGLRASDYNTLVSVGSLFYPACDFQRVAMDNGWGNEYLVLAQRYDEAVEKLKKAGVK